ncbi:MAG: DEAD/DEAH box helicase [Chlamydiia bacterium]|nr:DEAD/DEAH box helicase [Chlamydiia bacterium]
MNSPFEESHQKEGDTLIKEGDVKSIVFSGGTYQVEVHDPKLEEEFWPFLQVGDEGDVKDAFCTCSEAEQKRSCPHLAAAYAKIIKEDPLHIRFSDSFWNKLCMMSFKRHGVDPKVLEKKGEKEYVCKAESGEVLFSLKLKTDEGKKLLDEMIFQRPEETEETSLKFSNLPPEELALWKRGTPSQELQYELSFWSELAKWMILQEEFGIHYSIDFSLSEHTLPKKVTLNFKDLEFQFYIAEVNWKEIIPSLKQVKSSLPVHEFRDVMVQKMSYDPKAKQLHIASKPLEDNRGKDGVKIGEWEFFPESGFFPAKTSPLLKKKVIPQNKLGEFLQHNFKAVQKYLEGTSLSREAVTPHYELYFDEKKCLHVICYAFEKGDLQQEETALFHPWVYVEGRGFFPMKETLFEKTESIIPPEKIGDFINQHRLWLNEYDGFQIHLSNVEFRLTYTFDLKNLIFESESGTFEGSDEILDFGDWLYMKGKGFYKKVRARGLGQISPGKKIKAKEIPLFIHENQEELEQIKNFFSAICPLEKAGLNISMDEKNQIIVEPQYFYRPEYQGKEIHFFGDFTYVTGEGFSEIPLPARLPEKYRKKAVIDESGEPLFITVELTKLKSFIIKIDRRLKRPHNLTLKVNHIHKTEGKEWEVELAYVSEFGEESLSKIKESIDRHRSYAITEAGLLFFKDPRFNWLRELGTIEEDKMTFSTLEWIRLRTFENIEEPKENTEEAQKTRALLEELDTFETEDVLSIKGLQSTLRPYQEVGVKWLWFLYSYGLSGLLCDDMGLGKTHQAMALLAASRNARGEKKPQYFVVCPTSVLYHWEELLQKFLPDFKVVVFYGTQRTLKSFNQTADILLTSYGTLRSEREILSTLEFDIAILDEIQIAKNAQSQTHQALSMLRARTKIGLSGTPIENRLLELKALFDIVLPGYMPKPSIYRELFINPIEKLHDQEKRILLSRLIHPFVLRRKKSEVLHDLPEKIEEIAHCFLSEEQRKLYRDVVKKSRETLLKDIENSEKDVPYMHVFALLNTLKQICNHPALITKNIKNYHKHQSGKWDLFVELLEETRGSGQKLVVFSQYLDMMTIIESYLKENKIGYATIRGSTQDRKKQLQKFRDDPECEVFVASLKAAGTGVDLTAASVVIHYDRWWNPAKENQATDRVHRIGQNRGVQVFKMVNKNSIEEHIHALIERKISLTEGVIGYDDQDQIKHLDRDDLIQLLNQMNRDVET